MCAQFGREDRGETQENYGSAATCDVHCLQALSRRIHFGKFVAEAKFQQETERFVKLIKANDRKGIDEAITKPEVELKVLERLALKAKTYGTDPGFQPENGPKINVDAVVAMYKVSLHSTLDIPIRSVLTCVGICHPAHQGRRGRLPHAATQGHAMGVM